MIITIDGPAGSGKSTTARRLAGALGMAFLDSGATYRAATLRALREGVNLEDEQALVGVARQADIRLLNEPGGLRVMLDGEDVSRDIRSEQVSAASYYLARSPAVREVMVELQRHIARELGQFITEGRDQGSVVFPHADVKFYLDASPEIRARRRHAEAVAAGEQVTYEQVLEGIILRDRNDAARDVGPLVKPAGAIEIDTSDCTIEQATRRLIEHVEAMRK